MSASVLRPWIKAWAGAALIGVLNGVAREATYGKRVTESTAHQLSGVTGIAAFAGYFTVLQRRWPLPAARDAYVVGGVWLVFTVAFEFSFGRLVAKQSWEELTADYDVPAGRTWPFVLAWIAAGPAVTRAARRTR